MFSARYGGEGLTGLERNRLMPRELEAVPAGRRTARYRAVIALTAPDGREATVGRGRSRAMARARELLGRWAG